MKTRRNFLVESLLFALWTGLYFLDLTPRETVLSLGLLLFSAIVVEWPKKNVLPQKLIAVAVAHIPVVYSLKGLFLLSGYDNLLKKWIGATFFLVYLFQWSNLRLGVFSLLPKKSDRAIAVLVASIVFGFFALFFLPDFPALNRDLLASLPMRISEGYRMGIAAAIAYGIAFFAVPILSFRRIS